MAWGASHWALTVPPEGPSRYRFCPKCGGKIESYYYFDFYRGNVETRKCIGCGKTYPAAHDYMIMGRRFSV